MIRLRATAHKVTICRVRTCTGAHCLHSVTLQLFLFAAGGLFLLLGAGILQGAAAAARIFALFLSEHLDDDPYGGDQQDNTNYYILYRFAHCLSDFDDADFDDDTFFFAFGVSTTWVMRRLEGSRSTDRVISLIIPFCCAINSEAL